MATCPNCETALEVTAAECMHCGALFGPDSHWKPLAEPARRTFRDRLRPVFVVYALLGGAMAIFLMAGGEWAWFAAFIGIVISQPWWPLVSKLTILIWHNDRSFWPMAISAALNVLILGWLSYGSSVKGISAVRSEWLSLFLRCLAFVSLLGPLFAIMATQIVTLGNFGSAIPQYVGLVVLGFGDALIHSLLIVFAVALAARLMPSWLFELSTFGCVACGAMLGFVVGLVRWKWPLVSGSLYEVLIIAGPISVCSAIFLVSAMKILRSSYLMQPTGHQWPAADQER